MEERDEWIFASVSEEYKKLLQYLNRLYSEGLLNPEYITYSMDTYVQMACEGKTFVLMGDWLGNEKTTQKSCGRQDIRMRSGYPSIHWKDLQAHIWDG